MKRVRCPCGRVLILPGNRPAGKFRCPQCKAVLRVRGVESRGGDRGGEGGEGYGVAIDSPAAGSAAPAAMAAPAAAVWVPSSGPARAAKGRTTTATLLHPDKPKSDETVESDEFPGPFIDRPALLYPWLYPTWAYGLGLAFMTELTACAIGATLFFFFVIMSGMAFVSLFTFASMVMVCVGLLSYVLATFEMVMEQTAHGDNRLRHLPGYVWYELLPPLKRVFGAAASAAAVSIGTCYAAREWLGAWYEPQVLILNNLIVFLLFPVFMISNSVEQSFLPIWGLFETLPRLARCSGYFALFLIASGLAWAGIVTAFLLLSVLHIALAIAAAGPLYAIWLLYYGHWLGRVVRQMIALD